MMTESSSGPLGLPQCGWARNTGTHLGEWRETVMAITRRRRFFVWGATFLLVPARTAVWSAPPATRTLPRLRRPPARRTMRKPTGVNITAVGPTGMQRLVGACESGRFGPHVHLRAPAGRRAGGRVLVDADLGRGGAGPRRDPILRQGHRLAFIDNLERQRPALAPANCAAVGISVNQQCWSHLLQDVHGVGGFSDSALEP